MLRFERVCKTFSVGRLLSKSVIHAVWDASFEIAGEPVVFTLVGESGSGKTTIANLLLKTMNPTSGNIWLMNKNLKDYSKAQLIKIVQPVFQDPFETFNPLKRVEAYFLLMLKKMKTSKAKSSNYNLLERALNEVGLTLEDIKGRYPHELSGGQLQRLSIARSLLISPKILVADEPVSMLDASLRISVLNLFRKLRDQKVLHIFYITHDLATAYYISDYIAVILKGSIVESGPADKVLTSPLHPYTQLLRESVPDITKKTRQQIAKRQIESTVESAQLHLRHLCKFMYRCPYKREICEKKAPPALTLDGVAVRCWFYHNSVKGGV